MKPIFWILGLITFLVILPIIKGWDLLMAIANDVLNDDLG